MNTIIIMNCIPGSSPMKRGGLGFTGGGGSGHVISQSMQLQVDEFA